MSTQRNITHTCSIKDHKVYLDGQLLFEGEKHLAFKDFAKTIYKKTGHRYPKFFKMDKLSKLAYLCAEFLLKDSPALAKHAAEDIAVVIDCNMSSLDTDFAYQESLAKYPSPGLFVYTLPNIMIGEICIRHKIKGENACFVSERFDSERQLQYIDNLLNTAAAKACIAGHVDYFQGAYSAKLFLYE